MRKTKNNLKIYALLILILGLSAYNNVAFSQTSKEIELVDIKTYQYYLDKNWDLLITDGNKAIEKGLDFYYLRYRLGIAYYMKHNYIKALIHFEKAESLYGEDPILNEYIYYSRYFMNRKAEADLIAESYTEEIKSKLPIENTFVSYINFESGYLLSKTETQNLLGQNGFYGQEEQLNNLQYYHFGMGLNPTLGFKLYLGGSSLLINKTKRAEFSLDQGMTIRENKQDYLIHQNEFYSSGTVQGKAIKIIPAFHFIKVNYDLPYFELNASFDDYLIATTPISLNQYVGSLLLSGNFSYFNYDIYASYSNLNYANQLQFGANLYYFPFGNLNFYSKTGVKLFSESDENGMLQLSNKNSRLIFNQLFGFKISPKLWGETSITYGDLQNTNEGNAFVVYNLIDNIKLKADINLIFTLSKNLGFSVRYQIQQRTNNYLVYSDISITDNYENIDYTYFTNNIIGGLTWKF